MKKILTGVLTALLLTGFIFTGCKTQTPEDNNGNNNTENTEDSKDDEKKDEDSEVSGAAVTEFKATAGNAKVTLSWTNPATGTLSSIKIYNGTTDSPSTLVTTITDGKTSYEVTGLTNGTKYYFKAESAFTDDSKVYTSSVVSATPRDPSDLVNISSVDFAKELTIGWNLGNAFDANGNDSWAYSAGVNLEYGWLPHGASSKTTKELIKTVKNAGFKTIRIPVSWHNHLDYQNGDYTDTTYSIKTEWMSRVKEVVDWALEEDMFVIINIHHDNQTEESILDNPGFALSTNNSKKIISETFIKKIWEQIAAEFKNYDNRLIFEVLNEPRCVDTAYEWAISGDDATTYCNIITEYEQVGLNAIRSSGGNNATRFVMVPGYAASPSMLNKYTLPTDTANDKLLLSTHAYTPTSFALDGNLSNYDSNKSTIENAINGVFNDLKRDYINKGIGVVMGEASASDKENTASRVKWAKYYFAKAKAVGIPVVLWDNEVVVSELSAENKAKFDAGANGENHGYFNRKTLTQYFPSIITAMMNAEPDASMYADYGILDGELDLNSSTWSLNVELPASKFTSATTSNKLKFTFEKATGYTGSTGQFKIHEQWPNSEATPAVVPVLDQSFTVSLPGTKIYTPTAEEWAAIKSKGLIIFGYGPKITKLELQ